MQDHTTFEQLCYELVLELGFSNVRWRGPGPDGGRDIEAEWYFTDPSGHLCRENWYIECKFYTGSVPFSEIEPKLLAASANSRDFLLVITSSVLSNGCLDSVNTWLDSRNGRLRFRYWNGIDLSSRILGIPSVCKKYFPAIPSQDFHKLKQQVFSYEATVLGLDRRLSWDIASICQAVLGEFLVGANDPSFQSAKDNLIILSSKIHSLRALSAVEGNPSKRSVDLCEVLKLVERTCVVNHPINFEIPEGIFCVRTSAPLFLAMIFELTMNSSMYAVDTANVSMDAGEGIWKIRISNDHQETLDDGQWPQAFWRGQIGKRLYPGRSGLGCWIAHHISEKLGIQITWDRDPDKWITTIAGILEEN